jgi:hypothetical protein
MGCHQSRISSKNIVSPFVAPTVAATTKTEENDFVTIHDIDSPPIKIVLNGRTNVTSLVDDPDLLVTADAELKSPEKTKWADILDELCALDSLRPPRKF